MTYEERRHAKAQKVNALIAQGMSKSKACREMGMAWETYKKTLREGQPDAQPPVKATAIRQHKQPKFIDLEPAPTQNQITVVRCEVTQLSRVMEQLK